MRDVHGNGWRIMWVLAVFDLPTKSKIEVRRYTRFRNMLLEENFMQIQLSVYLRHFATIDVARATAQRIGSYTPDKGKTSFFLITDKQYGMTFNFYGNRPVDAAYAIKKPEQFFLFTDEQYL